MTNISINGVKKLDILEKEIALTNGALVLWKNNGEIINVYMVVSFRDNKNCYHGSPTGNYCSLINLDNGYLAFEERCSRKTTVKRVLNHLLKIGHNDYACNESIPVTRYGNYDIEIRKSGDYKLDITF